MYRNICYGSVNENTFVNFTASAVYTENDRSLFLFIRGFLISVSSVSQYAIGNYCLPSLSFARIINPFSHKKQSVFVKTYSHMLKNQGKTAIFFCSIAPFSKSFPCIYEIVLILENTKQIFLYSISFPAYRLYYRVKLPFSKPCLYKFPPKSYTIIAPYTLGNTVTALSYDQSALHFHPDNTLMFSLDPVYQKLNSKPPHLIPWNPDRSQHRF